jgi:hypothetical protein
MLYFWGIQIFQPVVPRKMKMGFIQTKMFATSPNIRDRV